MQAHARVKQWQGGRGGGGGTLGTDWATSSDQIRSGQISRPPHVAGSQHGPRSGVCRPPPQKAAQSPPPPTPLTHHHWVHHQRHVSAPLLAVRPHLACHHVHCLQGGQHAGLDGVSAQVWQAGGWGGGEGGASATWAAYTRPAGPLASQPARGIYDIYAPSAPHMESTTRLSVSAAASPLQCIWGHIGMPTCNGYTHTHPWVSRLAPHRDGCCRSAPPAAPPPGPLT